MTWNPEAPSDAAAWLALDELEQIEQIADWHEENPTPALHPPGLDLRLHSTMHAIVERQLAADDPPVVGETLRRLRGDGLRRHPAVHAIAKALMEQLHASMREQRPFDADAYGARLARIRPEDAIPVEGLSWMDRDEPRPNRAARRKKK